MSAPLSEIPTPSSQPTVPSDADLLHALGQTLLSIGPDAGINKVRSTLLSQHPNWTITSKRLRQLRSHISANPIVQTTPSKASLLEDKENQLQSTKKKMDDMKAELEYMQAVLKKTLEKEERLAKELERKGVERMLLFGKEEGEEEGFVRRLKRDGIIGEGYVLPERCEEVAVERGQGCKGEHGYEADEEGEIVIEVEFEEEEERVYEQEEEKEMVCTQEEQERVGHELQQCIADDESFIPLGAAFTEDTSSYENYEDQHNDHDESFSRTLREDNGVTFKQLPGGLEIIFDDTFDEWEEGLMVYPAPDYSSSGGSFSQTVCNEEDEERILQAMEEAANKMVRDVTADESENIQQRLMNYCYPPSTEQQDGYAHHAPRNGVFDPTRCPWVKRGIELGLYSYTPVRETSCQQLRRERSQFGNSTTAHLEFNPTIRDNAMRSRGALTELGMPYDEYVLGFLAEAELDIGRDATDEELANYLRLDWPYVGDIRPSYVGKLRSHPEHIVKYNAVSLERLRKVEEQAERDGGRIRAVERKVKVAMEKEREEEEKKNEEEEAKEKEDRDKTAKEQESKEINRIAKQQGSSLKTIDEKEEENKTAKDEDIENFHHLNIPCEELQGVLRKTHRLEVLHEQEEQNDRFANMSDSELLCEILWNIFVRIAFFVEDCWEVVTGLDWQLYATLALHFIAALLLIVVYAVMVAMYIGVDGRQVFGGVFRKLYGVYNPSAVLVFPSASSGRVMMR